MINAEKAIAVIEAEQNLLYGAYIEGGDVSPVVRCDNPGHCALGALLFAGGVTNEEMYAAAYIGEPSEWKQDDRFASVLEEEYGIHRRHATRIMDANDSCPGSVGVAARRINVVERIREIAAKQAEDPAWDAALCFEFDNPEPNPCESDD